MLRSTKCNAGPGKGVQDEFFYLAFRRSCARLARPDRLLNIIWGKLTNEDIAKIDGNHKLLNVTLQECYGCTNKEAEDQIQGYFKAVLVGSERSFAYDREQIVDQMQINTHKPE